MAFQGLQWNSHSSYTNMTLNMYINHSIHRTISKLYTYEHETRKGSRFTKWVLSSTFYKTHSHVNVFKGSNLKCFTRGRPLHHYKLCTAIKFNGLYISDKILVIYHSLESKLMLLNNWDENQLERYFLRTITDSDGLWIRKSIQNC